MLLKRGVLTESLHTLTFRRCERRIIVREDDSGSRVPERTPEKVAREVIAGDWHP